VRREAHIPGSTVGRTRPPSGKDRIIASLVCVAALQGSDGEVWILPDHSAQL
jgi:hypothetical protein